MAQGIQAAMVPLVASLAPWGVVEAHWLPGRDEQPVVWLTTQTEVQRVALQAQPWFLSQVQVTLTRLGVPHTTTWSLRVEFTSLEAQRGLFEG